MGSFSNILCRHSFYLFSSPIFVLPLASGPVLTMGYGNGEEACREDKEQRALHCPECMLNHSSLNKKNTQLRIFEWSYITVSSGISGLMLLSIYYRFHQRHIYKAKKEEDEHDNLKPASIAGGGNCSKS
ncbi:hypothetical protein YC2023_002675 [Brassica napus]